MPAPPSESPQPSGQLRDEVDGLVEAWQRERPDLDVSPMQVLSRVTRLARHLDKVRGAAFAGSGLESWEFDVLAALRRVGNPFRLMPSELAEALLTTRGGVTKRIDRLEKKGLVARIPNDTDRRSLYIALTAQGERLIDELIALHTQNESHLLSVLTPDEVGAFDLTLRKLLCAVGEAS